MNAQSKKQRIAQLLASGCSAGDVKLVVGVSEGYLKRLREDEEFNNMLRAYAAPDSEQASELEGATDASKESEQDRLSDRYAVLENKVVDQLIANAAMADTKELTNLLGVISKQRSNQQPPASVNIGVQGNATVSLTVPTSALGQDALQLSSNNEVVAVQGQSLTAMDTQGAQELLENARKERAAPLQRQAESRHSANGAAQEREEVYYDL